jgi:hypothetical protein
MKIGHRKEFLREILKEIREEVREGWSLLSI